jgi:hypothetical protein
MSIFSRFFGNEQKPASSRSTPPHIVVADYGEVLATRAPVPSSIGDVAELPYPKDEIKRAILSMLLVLTEKNDTQLQKHLKFAYVYLANWQIGVGPTHKGLDGTKLDRTKSPLDLAKEVIARDEEWQKWKPIVKAEEEALIGELRQLGLWSD